MGIAQKPLELWAGIECTHNRVHDRYFDQLDRTGHGSRIEDLDLIASLGAKAVRYPVLWERVAPESLDSCDWSWSDARLARLRELNIEPIIGLVHHGSGPEYTSLVDPQFAENLAQYAGAVARRYPWLRDYTPVNEALTTARFSGLYGVWYPHGCDDETFARCLLNECRGTVLAMRAIREINPKARLIQTDDLSHISSTPKLKYQADFENERRWLGFDLLCGRVDEEHPLWKYLTRDAMIPAEDLLWFKQNPCPPDVMGVNYYLSSERFLHEKLFLYPQRFHGGNGRDLYVDLETARLRNAGLVGITELLMQAWQRFGLPIAITECHNGCTREEQLRWIQQIWTGAEAARGKGAEVLAVTIWSLFGSVDWDSLVTEDNGHYEPGAFDVRSPQPRPTAIANLLRELGQGATPDHPLLQSPGWWQRQQRFTHGFSVLDSGTVIPCRKLELLHNSTEATRPLLIVGARGTLGKAMAHACESRGIQYRAVTRENMNLGDRSNVANVLEQLRPWAVVNAAGYVRVDDAESEPELCYRENALGPQILAEECARLGTRMVTFSSDMVFCGHKDGPYLESDPVFPLNVYGKSKAEAERRVLANLPGAFIIRTSAFFGPRDDYNFLTLALRALAAGEEFAAFSDYTVSPTYVPDLVHHALDLLIDGAEGIWHLANAGSCTWYDFARRGAELAGIDADALVATSARNSLLPARRPRQSALASEKAWVMPDLEDAMARYLRECQIGFRAAVVSRAA